MTLRLCGRCGHHEWQHVDATGFGQPAQNYCGGLLDVPGRLHGGVDKTACLCPGFLFDKEPFLLNAESQSGN